MTELSTGTEQTRRWGPLLTPEAWHEQLLKSHFSGVDALMTSGKNDEDSVFGVMVSTVSAPTSIEKAGPTSQVVIVRSEDSQLQDQLASSLRSRLAESQGLICDIVTLSEIGSYDMIQATCLFLPELDRPHLQALDVDAFSHLTRLLSTTSGVLWLTNHNDEQAANPLHGMITGLSRTVRSEREGFKFITLALEDIQDVQQIMENVLKVLGQTLFNDTSTFEEEYALKDGLLTINRVVGANHLTSQVSPGRNSTEFVRQRLDKAREQTLTMTIGSVGLLDTLGFVENLDYRKPMAPDEIELEPKALGLNFKDVLAALGQITTDHFGNDCAGVVTRVGEAAKGTFQVGDRVVAAPSGSFKTRVRCKDYAARKLPSWMDFAEAAVLPTIYLTAYYAVHHWARLGKGESVLIHSGAGGFGQACIQLAKLIGADIYTTVGTEEKVELLVELYGIERDHIFSSRTTGFAKGIKRMTKGQGVDVIINSLAGEGLRRSWDCIAPFGRFIEIGKRDIYAPGVRPLGGLPMFPFSKNVMFASVDLMLFLEKKELLNEIFQSVMALAAEKKIYAPKPLHRFKGSEIEAAFRFMQGGKHSGKIVIDFQPDDLIPVAPTTNPGCQFDGNSTYVIAGGLGGLGRSIARWMRRRGAMNLVLLSRSGDSNNETRPFLQELRAGGATVIAPPCDITDESRLAFVLEECNKTMPPIKGCIQASMVLKVSLTIRLPIWSDTKQMIVCVIRKHDDRFMGCHREAQSAGIVELAQTLAQGLGLLRHACIDLWDRWWDGPGQLRRWKHLPRRLGQAPGRTG